MFEFTEPLFWLTLAIILFAVEFMSPGTLFATIFGLGALVSSGLAFFTDNVFVLWLTFIASSLVFLVVLKPSLEKLFKTDKSKTKSNVDALIGQTGLVKEEITDSTKGTVTINHEDWQAVSHDGKNIKVDSKVAIEKVEGATLIVRLKEEKESE